jgi:Icc-related predicted phosphoesterase
MGKFKITLISDTHTKHKSIKSFLDGGDLLIHAGDFMNSGWDAMESSQFLHWFDSIEGYDTKIFIAGNHDRFVQNSPKGFQDMLNMYKTIEYLQDEELVLYNDGPNGNHPEDNIRIYGSPWQPEFYNWAFNLPRNGVELKGKWDLIPSNTDILITHSPPQTYLDTSGPPHNEPNLGCELLKERVELIKPKIHIFGHIHGGYGYKYNGDTHFINASILDERYNFVNKPLNIIWDSETNEIEFLNN